LYLHFLGVEAYALVTLYIVLLTTVQIFDFGLAQTLNRELARAYGIDNCAADMGDTVRTIEITYWVVVIAICCALALAAPLFSSHLVNPATLSRDTVQRTITIIFTVIALQWPVSLYQSGLMGLQEQIRANILRIGLATFGAAGSVLVLWLVSATIVAFFAWQLVAAAVSVAVTRYVFHSRMPRRRNAARFRPELLWRISRFAAGVSALTLVSVVLTQGDKWILVKRLPLTVFGYYALAWTVANALSLLTAPVFAAIFPRFSSLIARGERTALLALYHRATQAITVGIAPIALLLSLCSDDVLLAWTGNGEVAYFAGPLLGVLALGTLLNSLAHPPYASALAHGHIGSFLKVNLLSAAVAIPAVWLLTPAFGAMGAALMWFTVSAVNFVVAVPLAHRMLPREERVRWLLCDIALPLVAAVAVITTARLILPTIPGRIELILALIVALAFAMAASFAAAPALWTLIRTR